MNNIIKKILQEELSKKEVILFNNINTKKKELKTKKQILDYISEVLKYLGLNKDLSNYYYQLWRANYRKQGDYGKIPPEEFIGPKKLPARTVSNSRAFEFTKARAPFKGSNLNGKWEEDSKGVEYYVVTSYDWYPIYLFKENVWYKISDPYSSSTSKQMYKADPIEYDEKIGKDIILVTKKEMDMLMNNATYSDIMKNKKEELLRNKSKFLSTKPKFAQSFAWNRITPIKVKFKITDIRPSDDKVLIDVTIEDAGVRAEVKNKYGGMQISRKMIPSNGGYLRGEIPNTDKSRVENIVKNHIISNFKDYIGKYPSWDDESYDLSVTPEKHNLDFNFIHLNENN